MKQILGIAFGLALSTAACAADMPAPHHVATADTPFAWSGLYFGVNAGYGSGSSRYTDTAGTTTGDFDITGGLVGGTLGHNWQRGNVVWGLEGDLDWSSIDGSSTTTCGSSTPCQTHNDWLAMGRVRLGYAFNRWLPYITGGLALGDIKATYQATETNTKVGWTAGGGVEVALRSNWSAKLEYLYVSLPDGACTGACTISIPIAVRFNANLVRFGLNRHF